jgi:hypothetical protein
MIEQATLVEQEGGDAILFWLSDGELKWISGATETLRDTVDTFEVPEVRHYRCSTDGHVYAAPGTPKYRSPALELFARKRSTA